MDHDPVNLAAYEAAVLKQLKRLFPPEEDGAGGLRKERPQCRSCDAPQHLLDRLL
jgi:hypothetical protein